MEEIKAGQIITENLIDIRRPGTGIDPIHFDSIIGKKVKIDIKKEEPITFDMLE
jgi:sialic acid synthase SpsE